MTTRDGNTILDNLSGGLLSGIQLEGSFSMVPHDTINAHAVAGNVQRLILKLKEQERGTGQYTTLTSAAFLEVDVDMHKIHDFLASSSEVDKDDSHSLKACHIGTDPTWAEGKRAGSTQYRLDLHNFLNVPANLAADTSYDAATKVLTGPWFPAGAVVLDLDDSIDSARLSGNVTVSAADGSGKQFLVKSDQLEAGVMMYARVSVNCAETMPQISGATSFDPESQGGIVKGSDGGANAAGIKVVLTGLDNYSLAQVLTVAVDENQNGNIAIAEAADPDAADPDVFSQIINLSDLLGAGTVGAYMANQVETEIGKEANLIKSWTLSIDKIDHDSDGAFSGFCRELAKGTGRSNASPFNDGDKFIIKNPGTELKLNITPFQYSFQGGGAQLGGDAVHIVQTVKMFSDDLKVYAVLKQNAGDHAPMLKTAGGDAHQ